VEDVEEELGEALAVFRGRAVWRGRAGRRRYEGAGAGVGADPAVAVGGAVGGDQQRAHTTPVELGGQQVRRYPGGGQRVGA
jgi:hypothetical protein